MSVQVTRLKEVVREVETLTIETPYYFKAEFVEEDESWTSSYIYGKVTDDLSYRVIIEKNSFRVNKVVSIEKKPFTSAPRDYEDYYFAEENKSTKEEFESAVSEANELLAEVLNETGEA